MKRSKSIFKQILSLMLSCIMMLQLVPLSVFAADETSGSCGDKLSWRISGDTLYIEGEGEMYDYGDVYDDEGNWVEYIPTPWYGQNLYHVVLDDRITYIGTDAFNGNQFESIELPSKLKSIGNYAFAYSDKLTAVSLPEGLETMGTEVFISCASLETVSIPSTLKVIPYNTFWQCQKLANVTIAEGVEEIGEGVFSSCGINRIEIPASVKQIGSYAFERNSKLTELVLNDGLEKIGDSVFQGCNYLREVTIPVTVQAVGDYAFMPGPGDMWLGENSFMEKNPQGVMNLYVLSKDLSLYSTNMWGETTDLWTMYSTTIHAYADSRIAQEIEAYNAEISEDMVENRITFYPLTEGEHSFSDWAKVDEKKHSRTCGDGDAEEVRPHTLVIDMDNYTLRSCEEDESYRWICTACDYVGEFYTDPAWVATGHSLSDSYTQYEDYHTTWCYNCGEDFELPHEWAYAHDPNATEPYEVDAVCSVCGYTDTITVIPDGMTVISAKAQDENGDNVTLPEDAYTVVWKDSKGNVLGEGNQYTHTQDWEVTLSNPVIAVLTFSQEIRQAYSVSEKIEHTVTKLGENTEYVLTPRDTLTVTGKVSPLVGGTKVTLTTVLAGNESVIDLELDNKGVFTTQIRRTSATLTISAQGYETVQLENVQMITADENGVIDLGTLSLGDRFATEYLSVEYTDAESMAIARYLVQQNVSVVLTAEDGTEYYGAGIRKVPGESDTADSYKFRILLGRDVSDYFALGQQVTLSYLDPAGYVITSYTLTIARDGEQQPLPLVLEKAPELSIKLSQKANLFVFDEAGKRVYSGSTKNAKLLLEKGKYTVVAFADNSYVSTIDSTDMLEQAGIPDEIYVRETLDLTVDTEKSYTVPTFNLRSEIGFSVTVGQNLRVGDLVPIQITYSDKYDQGAAETAGLTFYIKAADGEPVLASVNGQYAFGTADMRLSEDWDAGSYNRLVVTTHQPAGTITVYAKATGNMLLIMAENAVGQAAVTLPGYYVEWAVPDTLDEAEGTLPLKAVLREGNAPFTANLYINGSLYSQTTLRFWGSGENMIPYALEKCDDGVSTHTLQLEVLDNNGESVWISPARMVMLTDTVDHPQPKVLKVRAAFANGNGYPIEERFDLLDGVASMNFNILASVLNEDNTFNSDLVFDYSLTMSNYTQVKNDVVYLKVFCGEDDPEPTITLVPLRLNTETYTFDGTFVMEANTCTGKDLPYGYSFEYATISPMKASINQAIGSVSGYMEELRDSYSENTFVYIDPDELEFNLNNCDSLTEEDKEVLRTLQAIENSMYTLRLQSEARIQSAVAESYGPGAVDSTLSDAEKLAAVYKAAGGTVESVEGITEADLLDMGYTAQMVEDNTVYLYTDEETGYVSAVDPVNGLHFYSGTPAAATFSGEALSDAQVEWLFLSILNSTKTLFDQVIDNLSDLRNYYNNTLATTLGCQGNVDSIKKQIAHYADYIDSLNQITDDMPVDERQMIESARKTMQKIQDLQAAEAHLAEMQKKLKWAQGELSVAARCVKDQQARHRLMTKLNSVLNGWEAVSNNSAFKGIFMVLDVRTVVLNVIDACSLYDVYESRAERIESTMDRADKAYRAMYRESLSECLANPEAAQEALEECSEIYDEFIVTCLEAQDWNRNWAFTHFVRLITDDASIAMGYLAKSPQGTIASMAVGLVGLTGECIGVNMFNSYLDDINELYPDLNSACLDPLPFAKKDDCEETDPDEDPDGSGDKEDEEEEDDDSNVGLGVGVSTDKEKPQYPIRTNPMIDPAGYVYEAVASNRIEDATAKIYYEGENGEEIYWGDADLYGEVNPQITDIDGRFAWMTPIGNWLVKITKDGYLDADSSNDPAAVDGWLPVPPPQLDVNIGLISTAAPTVVSAGVAPDQIRVVFSQYMDIAQVSGLVTVTQNGEPISVTVTFEDAEVSPTNAGVYYGRIMKLTRTDGEEFSGDGIVVTVDKSAKNYAGNSLAGDYVSNSMEVDQLIGSLSHSYPNRYVTDVAQTEQIVVQVLDTNGKPMAGVTVTARQKVGGTLEMSESSVSDANGRAVFTVKGIASGYDTVIFDAGVVSVEMNTRVSPLGTTAPKKPTANLSDYAEVEKGTQLILTYPGADDVIIYYTTDNTCPCTDSDARKIYDGPITITEDTFFRIAAWTQAGGYSERLNLHITVKVDDHICKDHLTPIAESGATCTEDGYKAHYQCECGKYFEDATASIEIPDIDAWKAGDGKIAKNGHNYTEQIKDAAHLKTAATKCTEYNIYWYACSVCGANAKDDPNAADKFYTSTEAGDHSFSEKLEDASHLVAGTGTDCQSVKKYYYDCAYCGEIGTTIWTSTTFGAHSFTEQIADDAHFVAGTGANCQDAKEYYYDCALCAEIGTISWVSTEMGDHEFDTTQWGYAEKETGHAHKCKYCTEHDTVQPHTPGAPATEDEDQICTVCLIVLVPKTGHICKNHLTPVAESGATCTEDGYKAHYKCSCGKYFEDASASVEIPDIDAWKAGDGKIAKNGHNYTEQVKDAAHLKTAATKCIEYNIYWYACSVCGANAKDDANATDKFYASTEAGDHSFSEKLEDASHLVAGTGTDCQNAKKYYYDCAYCGEIGTTIWTSTTFGAHSFTEQIADDAHFVAGTGANCQDAKEYYYDCALCAEIGTIYWVSTEMGDHEYDTTQWGYAEKETGHAHKCKYCTEHDTIQPHTPGAAATEDEDQICTVCLIVLVPKTGHICKNHLTPVAESGATCTVDGNIEYYTCSCGKWYSDATASVEITDKESVKIPAGHNYGTLKPAQPEIHTATELKAGVAAHYYCDKCDTYFTEGKVATTLAALTGATPSHSYATQYGYKEADGHADTCSCGAKNTVVAHTPDRAEATENDAVKCSACGYVITPALGHIHKNNLTKVGAQSADCENDGNIEYYTCSCGKWFEGASASVEITDKDSVKIKGDHNYGTEWKYDEDSCWNECVCGDKANVSKHADANNDGKCDACAYPVGKPSDSPQTGDNSHMVLWISLLMLSTLGVVATIIIIGKKRYSVK